MLQSKYIAPGRSLLRHAMHLEELRLRVYCYLLKQRARRVTLERVSTDRWPGILCSSIIEDGWQCVRCTGAVRYNELSMLPRSSFIWRSPEVR